MIEDLIARYVKEGTQTRASMQAKLFSIFAETTGHRPEDLCLVEQQVVKGTEYKTIYYFDWKSRHTYAQTMQTEAKED